MEKLLTYLLEPVPRVLMGRTMTQKGRLDVAITSVSSDTVWQTCQSATGIRRSRRDIRLDDMIAMCMRLTERNNSAIS
jgi:hypothetical protein